MVPSNNKKKLPAKNQNLEKDPLRNIYNKFIKTTK